MMLNGSLIGAVELVENLPILEQFKVNNQVVTRIEITKVDKNRNKLK
jgi:hypothetical protein